ncbi:MAG: hypothetical protein JWN56_2281 [Sphingobacteriales bacterium]|nr:hypothetical protein [Sphingobacteriales bacterium]
MSKVALLILFNHNYEANLPLLENIYSARFDNLFFIMPFYKGRKKNVINVHGNSFYFQGYIATALEVVKSEKYDHYIIIGDDLLLNPQIDQNNYSTFFKLNKETAFIPGPFLLNDPNVTSPCRPLAPYWAWTRSAFNFKLNQRGIEVSKFLPSYDQALTLLKNHGFEFSAVMPYKMFYSNKIWKSIFDRLFRNKPEYSLIELIYDIKNINKKIPYPVIGSYSDIIIIPHQNIVPFIRYCGIFSALNLFVEIALPTALAFSVDSIISEIDLNLKGITYWNSDDVTLFKEKYNSSLSCLYENFPEHTLYIHPLKLSEWKT